MTNAPGHLHAVACGFRQAAARISHERLALVSVLIIGLIIRCPVALGKILVLHPDETFQYFEQGHRLAFGSGVVPWEYIYGIRSWLLPALTAVVMKAVRGFSSDPLAYIYALRCIAAILSLVPVYVSFRMVLPKAGLAWATLAGLFSATWFHAVFLSPSLLTEVLAAYLMLPAILLAEDTSNGGRCKSGIIGILLGLAFCLRLQMAPALAAVAWWHCRRDYRHRWTPLLLAVAAVVCSISGLLDWLTLGSPFQSIWLNFDLNALQSISASFGSKPWFAYLFELAPRGAVALLPLLWLAVIGAYRAPLLAIVSVLVLVSHSFFAHKEYRFIVFVLLSLPTLIALGAATLVERFHVRLGPVAARVATLTVAIGVPLVSYFEWSRIRDEKYVPNAGIVEAFVSAHQRPALCGLGVADYVWAGTGGYTYLDRNVPIYYSRHLIPAGGSQVYGLDGLSLGRARTPMQMAVVLNGKRIEQLPGDSLFRNTRSFNYLIAAQGRKVPEFSTLACFSNGQGSPWPTACLLQRPGGCTEP